MPITKRPLGKSGISVAPFALGGNVFGWTADQAASFKVLDAFIDAGFDLIDTADVYSKWAPGNIGGESETIIGKWMKARGNRAKVTLATKCGMEFNAQDRGLSREYILRAVERSLKRLQTDHIDLYQAHKDDESTPLEETLGTYAELIKAGKIGTIGASNYSAERLAKTFEVSRANNLPRFECLQPHYNLIERQIFEEKLEAVCLKEGIAVIPYWALAKGFLTGKYRSEADLSKSTRGGSVKAYLNERGMRILNALDYAAAKLQSTPARVAMAWLMARPSITAPIASATSTEQLKDLTASAELKLGGDLMALLDAASAWK
jgi:aryl-alcohol dehydrogenase-like predicted oxidoreductase